MKEFIPHFGAVFIFHCILILALYIIRRKRGKRHEMKVKKDELATEVASNIQDVSENISSEEKDNSSVVSQLPEMRWVKVGEVVNLQIYPLISGKAYAVDECHMFKGIFFKGMKMFKEGKIIDWDRSFLIYDMTTNHIITTGNFPELHELDVLIKKNKIILQAGGMPPIHVRLIQSKLVECTFWCDEVLEKPGKIVCIDCGDKAAKWLSSFLCGLNTGVRLGYAVDAVREMGISWQYWLRDCILHQRVKCNRNYLGPFASVLHSVVLSSLSYDEISRKLKEYNPNQMICPNIIVSASNLYADKVWEWIKIGDVIINNTQPLVVWPKEGEQSEVIRLFGLGINCQVYLPGCVKLNDNVYLHIPKSEEEMKSKENITEESNVTQHSNF
ncbi:uncharacterized protein LOC105184616 [Harpegnathos saltator]|uniref:uncharacterized protein LOC105184616 n=1 Tax=Harpegnathos saltator TaxID=610380 RepID=UPI00058C49D9|nr:uncharacterized protein LOC105184616 [Harpegnathos saltator]